MRNVYLKVNGEMAGICDRLDLKETKYGHSSLVEIGGSVGRIKVSDRNLVKILTGAIYQNTAIDLEFETIDSIYKAHRAWVISYTCFEDPSENAIIVEDLDFKCESLVLLDKISAIRKFLQESPIVPNDQAVNNFTAAITNYYKKVK